MAAETIATPSAAVLAAKAKRTGTTPVLPATPAVPKVTTPTTPVTTPSLKGTLPSTGAEQIQTPTANVLAAKEARANAPVVIVTRDLAKEDKVAQNLGGAPKTAKEFATMLKATYSPAQLEAMGLTQNQVNAMTNGGTIGNGQAGQIAAYDPAKLKAAGFSEAQIQALAAQGQQANQAQQQLNATPQPTNAMLGVLQQALKVKSGVGNQAIGQSEVFKQAGLPQEGALGYSALAQSMQQRRAEMGQKYDSYANLIQQVGGQMNDTYKNALDSYKATMDQYDKEVERYEKLNAEQRQLDQQLDLLARKAQVDKDMYEFQAQVQAKADAGFYDPTYNPVKIGDTNVASINSVSNDSLANIFYQKGASDYGHGDGKRECGEAYNDITDGKKVGSSYASKLALTTKRDNAAVGNGLVIPLGGEKYGHIETVIARDTDNGNFKTVSWNRDGKGGFSVQTYSIADLNKKYGKNWGFIDSKLKPQYAEKLGVVANESKGSVWQDFYNQAASAGITKPKERQEWADEQTKKYLEAENKSDNGGGGSGIEELARTIMSPYSNLTLTDLTTDQRGPVAAALNKMKEEAMKTGDVVGVVRASAGGKPLDATAVTSLEKTFIVKEQLASLSQDLFSGKVDTGPIMGIVSSNNPYDQKAQLIKAKLNALIPGLARGVYGEVGVLTDKDVEQYSKTVAKLTSTAEVNAAIIGMTQDLVAKSIENKLMTQARAGRDVSGYADILADLEGTDTPLIQAAQNNSYNNNNMFVNAPGKQPWEVGYGKTTSSSGTNYFSSLLNHLANGGGVEDSHADYYIPKTNSNYITSLD